jgi:prepilin-type N-terminal cleavage/methylation domain-containing protein
MTRIYTAANFSRPSARAFTLIELMISIALVLLLMLGINQVFKVTGEAVGTNLAVSSGLRDARAVQAVFGNDFTAWRSDSPAIVIRSERVSAFRNKADEQQDRDWTAGNPNNPAKLTADIDGNGLEGEPGVPGERIPPAIYNDRSHRVDVLNFFAGGFFRRQTGGAPTAPGVYADEYVADMSSPDAWVWYGHIKRPDERAVPTGNNSGFPHRDPGENPDPNASPDPVHNDKNFYASDFVLGRVAMLLVPPTDTDDPPDGSVEIRDRRGIKQYYIERGASAGTASLAPLSLNSGWNGSTAPDQQWLIQWSRFDLAGTTPGAFKDILTTSIAAGNADWFDDMSTWRFESDPQPLRPLTAGHAARTTPVILEHCSQFVVEYAGDFVVQDPNTGAIVACRVDDKTDPADGVDYILDPVTRKRQIRWYGMPRDVGGQSGAPDGAIPATGSLAQLVDVLPLRDVLVAGGQWPPPLPAGVEFFERRCPNDPPNATALGPPPNDYTNVTGGMRSDGVYVAAWGPDTGDQPRPKMIRIVVTIDDPDGRIAEGQTFEYVYRVGG